MSTIHQRPQAAKPQQPTRKSRKEEARTQRQDAARRRQLRLLIPIALVVAALIAVAAIYQLRQSAGPADALFLNSTVGSGGGLAWAPDGGTLAVNGTVENHDVTIYDTGDGHPIRPLYGAGRLTSGLAWSADGAFVAVGAQPAAPRNAKASHLVDLWRAADWSRLGGTSLPGAAARNVAFSPDSKRLALQNAGHLIVLAVPSLRILVDLPYPLAAEVVHPILSWSPDGRRIAVGLTSRTRQNVVSVGILDSGTLRELRSIALAAKFPGLLIATAAWSPDGRTLAVAGQDGTVATFDPRTAHKIRNLASPLNTITALAWAPSGNRLAVGGVGSLAVLDAATGGLVQQRQAPVDLPGSPAVINTVEALAWSPDGARLAISGDNARPQIWQVPASAR